MGFSILGSAAIGAGASLLGSSKASDAAKQAAAIQQQMFQTSLKNQQPFIDFGQGLLPTLTNLLTPGPNQNSTLQQLPGFQFAQQQGQKAITNQATARGISGNALRAGADYATGSASQSFNTLLQQILQGAGIGSGAAGAVGNQSVQAGANIGAATQNAGNASAAGILGAGNALSGGVNNLASMQFLNQLTGGKFAPTAAAGMYGGLSPAAVFGGSNPFSIGGGITP